MKSILNKNIAALLVTAAFLNTAALAQTSVLIGGVGFETLVNTGDTYDRDYTTVLGSAQSFYSDILAPGRSSSDRTAADDPVSSYPSRVRVNWDGSHGSSAWDGEAGTFVAGGVGGTVAGSVGKSILTRPIGPHFDTAGTSSDFDAGADLGRALDFHLADGYSFSFSIDATGYELTSLAFAASSSLFAGGADAEVTLNFGYISGGSLIDLGISEVVDGSAWSLYQVDLSSAGLANGSFDLVATFSGSNLSAQRFSIDNVQVIGAASAIPEPSTYAAILGGAALAGVLVLRRRKTTAVALGGVARG